MKISSNHITLRQPDDWHLHLRDGLILPDIVSYSARVFARAIVMPNLNPPVRSIEAAINYKKRILEAVQPGCSFTPFMTAYLTNDLSPDHLEKGYINGTFFAAKLYPANVTTNSSYGIRDLGSIDSILETMERIGMPLLIHGEVLDSSVDIFDREEVFIDRHLEPMLRRYPSLRVVLEHITTRKAIEFVESATSPLAATITPHHLHINRNAMFEGGLRSDFYCLPVAKREQHRLALRRAATSGKPCFFLGTDSAPHLRKFKESACSCAGIFNAPIAIESYVEVFEQENALDKLEVFASENGAKFYGIPLNAGEITLTRSSQRVPEYIDLNDGRNCERVVPFHSGQDLRWSIVDNKN